LLPSRRRRGLKRFFFAVFLFRFPISPDAMPIKKGNF